MGQLEARHVSENALPVIDISGLSSPDQKTRQAVGEEIRAACLDLGFMYIVGHGVSADTRDTVFKETAAFFSLPEDRKLALDMENSIGNAGYEPLRAQTLETGSPPDLKEGFYIGEELTLDHPRVRAGGFNLGPNQWPDGAPRFREVMSAYYDEMLVLGELLMRGVALSLRLEENFFEDFCNEPLAGLRLLHYPPQPGNAHPDEKGCGAHTDFGGITMLMQDDNGGLQVMGADGEWIHAPPMADSYIVNLGDMVARWTNDRYRSTLHRVVNFSGRERYSIPFFYSGRLNHEVSALPGCLSEGEAPKYPPTTVEAHMREMYARTYL
jgi:isopenicillin N synthase-like dioxygenase